MKQRSFIVVVVSCLLFSISCEVTEKHKQQVQQNTQQQIKVEQTEDIDSWHVKHMTNNGNVIIECDTDGKPEAWAGGVCFTDKATGLRWSVNGGITDMTYMERK